MNRRQKNSLWIKIMADNNKFTRLDNMSEKNTRNLLRKRGVPLARFKLSVKDGSPKSVFIYADAPVITIIGASGAWKSVMALWLAQQAIEQNIPVKYITTKIPPPGSPSLDNDLASQRVHQLLRSQSDLFELEELPFQKKLTPFSDLPAPKKGALYVIDEAQMISAGPATESELWEWVAGFNGMLCICSQTPEIQLATVPWDTDMPPIGLGLFGKLISANYPDATRNMARFIRLTNQLEYQRERHTEFIAADIRSDWLGVVRLPIASNIVFNQ